MIFLITAKSLAARGGLPAAHSEVAECAGARPMLGGSRRSRPARRAHRDTPHFSTPGGTHE